MKAVTLFVVIALMAVFFVTLPAGAATQARDPRVPALQRQVRTLQSQVATLSAGLTEATRLIGVVNDKDTCGTAIVFDVFRVLIAGLGGGDIGRFNDNGACARVGVTRPQRSAYQARPDLTADAVRLLRSLQRESR